MASNYGMITDDNVHWRGFVRHYPSGEVYILEQDQPPGYDGANYTALIGPLHHSEVTAAVLAETPSSHGDPKDLSWATEQMWSPIETEGAEEINPYPRAFPTADNN